VVGDAEHPDQELELLRAACCGLLAACSLGNRAASSTQSAASSPQ
jgi:hypothetical protein